MSESNLPDPWGIKSVLSIDDGGGKSFSSGYDVGGGFTISVPKYVGRWEISQTFHVYVGKKPSWLHRKMTEFLLGWIWQDS
jgi:hypothetical protein